MQKQQKQSYLFSNEGMHGLHNSRKIVVHVLQGSLKRAAGDLLIAEILLFLLPNRKANLRIICNRSYTDIIKNARTSSRCSK